MQLADKELKCVDCDARGLNERGEHILDVRRKEAAREKRREENREIVEGKKQAA